MIRKLLPLLLALVGLAGGLGAGVFLRPAPEPAEVDAEATDTHAEADKEAGDHEAAPGLTEFVKMNNQFVVPVVERGKVSALVVLSLSLEVETGTTESIYEREPKLRDVFLQVLFDHANVGGFSGSFTDGANLVVLRTSLREAAGLVLGKTVKDVLITDIARQDS
jgi:flagellar protein FliL